MFLNKRQIKKLTSWSVFLFDTLYPIQCLGCKTGTNYLCNKCSNSIPTNNNSRCPICHKNSPWGKLCQECKPNNSLDGVFSAYNYKHPLIKQLITTLKYNFIRSVDKDIGLLIDKSISEYSKYFSQDEIPKIFRKEIDVTIIPVPLHKFRERWRGFNQSNEIAKNIKYWPKAKLEFNTLKRIKYTKQQAKLNKNKRTKNTKNAFQVQGDQKNKTIILVDDVASSKSTLNECARILKNKGAKSVWSIVFAHQAE